MTITNNMCNKENPSFDLFAIKMLSKLGHNYQTDGIVSQKFLLFNREFEVVETRTTYILKYKEKKKRFSNVITLCESIYKTLLPFKQKYSFE